MYFGVIVMVRSSSCVTVVAETDIKGGSVNVIVAVASVVTTTAVVAGGRALPHADVDPPSTGTTEYVARLSTRGILS